MHIPGFSKESHYLGLGFQQSLQNGIVLHRFLWITGTTEGGDFCLGKVGTLGLLKKIDISWIRSRPAALYIMHSQFVQFVGDADFILDSEGDTFRLGPVPESGVVYFHRTHF